jgi:hypothetical protein
MIEIRIRDGRRGRDLSKVDPEGLGEVLGEFNAKQPLDLGDKIRLADGTDVIVIGCNERIDTGRWTQEVSVGEL